MEHGCFSPALPGLGAGGFLWRPCSGQSLQGTVQMSLCQFPGRSPIQILAESLEILEFLVIPRQLF